MQWHSMHASPLPLSLPASRTHSGEERGLRVEPLLPRRTLRASERGTLTAAPGEEERTKEQEEEEECEGEGGGRGLLLSIAN